MRLVIVLSIFALSHGFGQRQKRSMLGGHEEIPMDPSNQALTNGIDEAVRKFNAANNYCNLWKKLEVTKVTQQVVEGMMYTVSMQLGPTTSPNTAGANVAECAPQPDGGSLRCDAKIWSRPWLPIVSEKLMVKITCQ